MAHSTDINDYKMEFCKTSNCWTLRNTNTGYTYSSFYGTPTGNCQLFTAYEFRMLLDNFDNDFVKELTRIALKSLLKNIMLLDIEQQYIGRVSDIFAGDVIINTPYDSTNGSKMVIMLIKTKYLR